MKNENDDKLLLHCSVIAATDYLLFFNNGVIESITPLPEADDNVDNYTEIEAKSRLLSELQQENKILEKKKEISLEFIQTIMK